MVTLIITPEPGQQVAIAKLLLSLADHPAQVQSVSWPSQSFAVPQELFDKFEAAYHPDTSDVKDKASSGKQDAESDDSKPAAKRRGRSRKTDEGE